MTTAASMKASKSISAEQFAEAFNLGVTQVKGIILDFIGSAGEEIKQLSVVDDHLGFVVKFHGTVTTDPMNIYVRERNGKTIAFWDRLVRGQIERKEFKPSQLRGRLMARICVN